MVDEKKISFNPAVELSYLDESQQRDFLEAMEDTQNAPSLSQAQQLKKMAQQGEFSYEKAFDVMGQLFSASPTNRTQKHLNVSGISCLPQATQRKRVDIVDENLSTRYTEDGCGVLVRQRTTTTRSLATE